MRLSSSRPFQRRPRAFRHGASVVEFAIVIPIFFLFILALIEIGRGMMVTNLVHNAARAGCREGILPNKADNDITTAVDAALSGQGLKGRTITIKVNDTVANASTAQSKDEVTVVVSVPVTQNTWLPFAGSITGNLVGQYTLTRE
jgi:Flp pilus assembly protein TadG